MKVGIIGTGHIAEVHIRAIRAAPDVTVVGVADSFLEYARAFAERFEIPHACESASSLIAAAAPDVVHVLTPPATHHEVVVECLDRGCHVLVEKPMSLDTAEADEMLDAARRNGVLLSVDHNCRFEAAVHRASQLLESGHLGDLVTLEVTLGFDINRYPALVQAGAEHSHWAYRQLNGGPLQDQMPHPVSVITPYLGEIRNVVSLARNRGVLPEPWDDEIRVLIDGKEAHAEVYVSFSQRPDTMVFTIRGSEGTAIASVDSNTVTVDRTSALPRAAARGLAGFRRSRQNLQAALGNIGSVATGRMDTTGGIAPVVSGFYDAIRTGGEPPVSMEEGRRVVDLIERIWPEPVHREAVDESSSSQGQTRVLSLTSPTVLVTGAGGFIGSHLVQRLIDTGHSVRAFVRPSSYGLGLLKTMDVEIVHGDIVHADALHKAMEGIDTVYHAAAPLSGDWESVRRSTVDGTRNLVEAASAANVARLVHFSSLAVYRALGSPREGRIEEDWPYESEPERLGSYARAKIEAEQVVLQAIAEGELPATIVRPGIVIGPRGGPLFPHLGFKLKDRVFLVPGSGKGVLPLIYIDNLLDALLLCATRDEAVGQTYNLVDDGGITVLDYLKRFVSETGLDSKIVRIPFALPYCAAGAYELAAAAGLVKKGATSRVQLRWKQASLNFRIDNSRAKRDLGWTPQVGLDAALSRSFQYYAATQR